MRPGILCWGEPGEVQKQHLPARAMAEEEKVDDSVPEWHASPEGVAHGKYVVQDWLEGDDSSSDEEGVAGDRDGLHTSFVRYEDDEDNADGTEGGVGAVVHDGGFVEH